MHLLVRFLAVVLLSASGFAATVPADITKTVVFLCRDGPTPNAPVPHGTGFLIGIPDPAHPNQNWVYLVTAKHALHTNKDDFDSPLYQRLYVRLNKKSGPPEWDVIDVVTSGSGQTVFLR